MKLISTSRLKTLCQNLLTARESLRQALNTHSGLSISPTLKLRAYAMYITSGLKVGDPEAEPKDVNFFDYDGTLRYSYTVSEFYSLTALPKLPTHRNGLVSQEWNWTLSDAVTEVENTGKLNIGLSCAAEDGKTWLFVRIPEDGFVLGMNITESSNVSWTLGWGETTSDINSWHDIRPESPGSGSVYSTYYHRYSKKGNYIIKINNPSSGTISLGHGPYRAVFGEGLTWATCNPRQCSVLYSAWMGTGNVMYAYNTFKCQTALETIAIPKQLINSISSFDNCTNLKFIVFPNVNYFYDSTLNANSCFSLQGVSFSKYVTSIGSSCCTNCRSLRYFVPTSYFDTITSGSGSGSYGFQYCVSLQEIDIPDGISTGIGTTMFGDCRSLKTLTIPPAAITSIGNTAFTNCYSLKTLSIGTEVTTMGNNIVQNDAALTSIYMRPTTPPTISSTTFNTLPSGCNFYVPGMSWAKYKTATNWSGIIRTPTTWDAGDGNLYIDPHESSDYLIYSVTILVPSTEATLALSSWDYVQYKTGLLPSSPVTCTSVGRLLMCDYTTDEYFLRNVLRVYIYDDSPRYPEMRCFTNFTIEAVINAASNGGHAGILIKGTEITHGFHCSIKLFANNASDTSITFS